MRNKILRNIIIIIAGMLINANISGNDINFGSMPNADMRENNIDSNNHDYEIKNCTIEHFSFYAHNIDKCRLAFNDSTAIFMAQTFEQRNLNEYTEVKLNTHALTLVKSLLYDLYSNHNSAINDSIIDKYRNFQYHDRMSYWHIKLTLNGQQIDEMIPLLSHIEFRGVQNVFNSQFYNLCKFIFEIAERFELELYKDKNIKSEKVKMDRLNSLKQKYGDLYGPYKVIKK